MFEDVTTQPEEIAFKLFVELANKYDGGQSKWFDGGEWGYSLLGAKPSGARLWHGYAIMCRRWTYMGGKVYEFTLMKASCEQDVRNTRGRDHLYCYWLRIDVSQTQGNSIGHGDNQKEPFLVAPHYELVRYIQDRVQAMWQQQEPVHEGKTPQAA